MKLGKDVIDPIIEYVTIGDRIEGVTYRTQEIDSFPLAVASVEDEILDPAANNLAFVDVDHTLSGGFWAGASKWPVIAHAAEFGRKKFHGTYFPPKNIDALRTLHMLLDMNVCIATNRDRNVQRIWKSGDFLNQLDIEMIHGGIYMEMYTKMDRAIQNRFIRPNDYTYNRMVDWLLGRLDPAKKHIQLILIADYDFFGLNWSEKQFLYTVAERIRARGINDPIDLVHLRLPGSVKSNGRKVVKAVHSLLGGKD